MKFSLLVLVSLFLFFAATAASASVVDVTPDDKFGGPGRPRRTLSSKKNPLPPPPAAAAAAAAAPVPSWELAEQGAPDCSITQQASTGKYTLRATVGRETVLYSERPVRSARTMATQEFVEQFENLFVTFNPNAAIIFTGNKDASPLNLELSRPRMIGSSIIEYTMTQSESKAEVASIDQFLATSGTCLIFIDSILNDGWEARRFRSLYRYKWYNEIKEHTIA